ncbi:MAG: tRNA preQ1(34) S-adenosylmethionine ribosyltransferase-isomerase QueA [Marinovum sp.]|nr:tRNA preQ1(34) S-adenosylmethionine ribosyltransferase-isomerase QueA [Marinovum sp.]
MHLSDFDFDLPEKLIATRPVSPRSAARLLWCEGAHTLDRNVTDLVNILRPGDRLVLNETKVIPARLFGTRHRAGAVGGSGKAAIEVTLLSFTPKAQWTALVRPLRKVAIGEQIEFGHGLSATLVDKFDGQAALSFNLVGEHFDRALAKVGKMPLPPYIAAKRPADEQDKLDYQAVFAHTQGSVAAPTASLHFDADLLTALAQKGIEFTYVTLHVGAGTFLPVKAELVKDHKMHSETGHVSPKASAEITQTIQNGRRVIPVGTTALRLIETAAQKNGILQPWSGATDIFIYPGYKFKIASGLMTNFHLPKSTLLMLVSALMGQTRVNEIYSHAINENYRFFSYGDASLLIPSETNKVD